MFDEENQMGLFEIPGAPQELRVPPPVQPPPPAAKSTSSTKSAPAPKPAVLKPAPAHATKPAPPRPAAATARKGKVSASTDAPPVKKVSGLVPEGDVRLTANIRQDLHLKLKIASAHRRTTIGEILEELIDAHL